MSDRIQTTTGVEPLNAASAAGSVAAQGAAPIAQLALVGLDADLTNRVTAACWRLSAQGHDVRLLGWSGVRCDLLLLGSAETNARVLDAARERRVPVLKFVHLEQGQAPADGEISSNSSVEQILRKLLEGVGSPAAASSARAQRGGFERPSGLLWLMINRRPSSGAIHASSDAFEVWIAPERALVCARTHSDIFEARARVLSPQWRFQRVRASRVPDGPTIDIDEFFLDACMRVSHRLPVFAGGSYRLVRRPAYAGPELAAEIAALGAQFAARDEVSSADLAALADVGQHHANAFLWATLASGALEPQTGKTNHDAVPQSLFARVRASMGLGRR